MEHAVRLNDSLEDEALIRRIAARDSQAFETLYRKYTPRLRGYLARQLGPLPVVEEVYDDVMHVVWQRAACFVPTCRLSTWIFGIARRQALKARAQTTTVQPKVEAVTVPPFGLDDAEVEALRQEQDHLVARAVAALPSVLSLTVTLAYYQHYSYRQIAAHTDCSVHTVKMRLCRARRRLGTSLSAMTRPPIAVRELTTQSMS